MTESIARPDGLLVRPVNLDKSHRRAKLGLLELLDRDIHFRTVVAPMLSRTAEYAIRAVAYLAGQDGTPRTAAQISAATQIPAGYLSKVMQSLGRADLVASQRGLHGGFTLTKSPEQLTILDVVGAVDPPKRVHQCPLRIKAHSTLCPLHKRLDRVYAMFEDALRETTMADMLVPPRCDNAGTQELM